MASLINVVRQVFKFLVYLLLFQLAFVVMDKTKAVRTSAEGNSLSGASLMSMFSVLLARSLTPFFAACTVSLAYHNNIRKRRTSTDRRVHTASAIALSSFFTSFVISLACFSSCLSMVVSINLSSETTWKLNMNKQV